ncbi:hypothetical protein [Pseudomonas fluorescens]|nr:hypothetical protein [Pseudomonas fluorescens]
MNRPSATNAVQADGGAGLLRDAAQLTGGAMRSESVLQAWTFLNINDLA